MKSSTNVIWLNFLKHYSSSIIHLFIEACTDYKGTCLDQSRYRCNGEFRLLGDKSEILCKDWYAKNQRCCVSRTSAPVTSAPAKSPSSNSGKSRCY